MKGPHSATVDSRSNRDRAGARGAAALAALLALACFAFGAEAQSAPGAAAAAAAQSEPAPVADPAATTAPADARPGDAPPPPPAVQDANAGGPPPPPTYDTNATTESASLATGGAPADTGAEAGSGRKGGVLKNMYIALGGRMGYALPIGDFVQDRALDDLVAGAVPLIFDAGLRFRNGTEAGLYLQLTFGASGEALDEGCSDCSVFGARLGAQLNQHLAPEATLDPWIGLGLGIEVLTISERRTASGFGLTRSTHYRALPEVVAQVGLDIGGLPFALGPYASFSLAQYSDVETTVSCSSLGCPGGSATTGTGTIADGALHSWLQLGLRGVYTL